MKRLYLTLLLVVPLVSMAQDPLVVAIKHAPPFVIDEGDGWSGISVELIEQIADRLDRDLRFERFDTVAELLEAVRAERVSLGVGALSVTPEREAILDFSHPYFQGGIAIATTHSSSWIGLLRSLFSPRFLTLIVVLVVVLAAIGALIWLLERRANPEHFGGSVGQGIGSGFWWSAVTMTTVGYGDKAPVTAAGRFLALVWMFVSVVTISSFTAAIASSFTLAQLSSQVRGPEDLRGVRVQTISDTAAAQALDHRELDYESAADLEALIQHLRSGKADAIVYDEPLLRYQLHVDKIENVFLLGDILEVTFYAFALPGKSDLREPVNRELLGVLESPDWQELIGRYFGE